MIINADDLGLSDTVNDAIAEALARGWCTSASVLANGPAFTTIVPSLRGLDRPDVGVHLNLSEFAPLLGLGELRELFPDGVMGPAALRASVRHRDAIVREWTAQVARVRAAGLEPTHLDSHQHLHGWPVLRSALARVAEASGVRRVRTLGGFRPGVDPIRQLLQRARAARFTRGLRRDRLSTTDHFANASVFRTLLERGRPPRGSIEVMAHPGNPAHPHYADELRWLATSWERDLPVERISWRQLR